jgi:DHA2 family methylenomycin A resistance protein-like MFS transporter
VAHIRAKIFLHAEKDMNSAITLAPGRDSAFPTLAVVATSFGFALVQLDVSIITVALARIGRDLSANIANLQWVVDAYAITFASLLLGAGALGDRLGSRRIYLSGLALFTLASLGCGMAPGQGALIAARVLQGVGASVLVPCSLALLTHECGHDAALRTRAISVWTAAGSVALSAGPLLGGILVDTVGWRSIFLVNLPLGVIGIWLVYQAVAETWPSQTAADPAGQSLAVVTLFCLTGAVIEGGRAGFASPLALGGFVAALFSGIGLLAVESRVSDPMLPLGFFRSATFSAATLLGLVINLTLYGLIFVLGLYLQQELHYSPLLAGLAFLPFPVVLGVANIAAAYVAGGYSPRTRMAIGLGVAAVGFCLLSRLHGNSAYWSLLPGMVMIPAGVGLAVPLMTATLLSTVPRDRTGTASGVLNTVRQSGGAIGVALFGALLAAHGVAGIRIALMLSAAVLAVVGLTAGLPRYSRSAPR